MKTRLPNTPVGALVCARLKDGVVAGVLELPLQREGELVRVKLNPDSVFARRFDNTPLLQNELRAKAGRAWYALEVCELKCETDMEKVVLAWWV